MDIIYRNGKIRNTNKPEIFETQINLKYSKGKQQLLLIIFLLFR